MDVCMVLAARSLDVNRVYLVCATIPRFQPTCTILSAMQHMNIVNVTVELSSFGRTKEEKLKPHLRPLREAATTTWSKHSLGHSQPSQPGSQRGQPVTHHRQRETSDVREPSEDTHSRHGDKRRWRNGSSTTATLKKSKLGTN
ncbi:hypothetical protein Taro_022438 [Colocasia esculenta]|uniref:Uncharacterized protein n=1 Tax=Colocasia esculenta TaxID=4460 RepID=A0A843VBC5_COLES|nr:hypothetical protein [Colocasia esculenta]